MKSGDEERPLDIHDYMVDHPASTFFLKMEGEGPEGIEAGDVLVVDRTLTPKRGSVIVAAVEGELRVERFQKTEEELELWGVVTGFLRRLDRA